MCVCVCLVTTNALVTLTAVGDGADGVVECELLAVDHDEIQCEVPAGG